MSVIRPQPTNILGQTILDVRISPKLGKELAEDIAESVNWTQRFIQMTLPDVLLVTQKQFASLNGYTEEMYQTTDRMFTTPLNVMEVTIDREVDTVTEVEQIMQDVEDLKKQEAASNEPTHQ